jgi:Lamin Tail Domain
MKKFYTLSLLLALGLSANAQVVISQVYGGGGNAGATYTNDFIELFNRGTVAQNLAGWSVQYTSATGPSGATTPNWITTVLPSFNLQPGQYFLIHLLQI